MNTAQDLTNALSNWKTMGMSKAELVVKIAEFCMGWPYVWGGLGELCTPTNRENYAKRSNCPAGESAEIRRLCQRISGGKTTCDGCKWYPGGATRFFDCRGFTRLVLQWACNWTLQGGGATSQYNTDSNWKAKGDIKDMPLNQVCCVFMWDAKKKNYSHTGLHIGGGNVIHCSGEVKRGKITDKGWSNYAIPVCIEGDVPVPTPGEDFPTLRKGSSGEYVTLLQTKLIQKGYDLQPFGADGKYGSKTVNAVTEFQKDNDLKADGICGKNTWSAIMSSENVYYTVLIKHVSKKVADDIVSKYGGEMTKEVR